jgi:hypothetical protein
LDEDEFNARLAEERRRDLERDTQALEDDHRPYVERNRVGVSMGTGKPRYWKREDASPRSGRGS